MAQGKSSSRLETIGRKLGQRSRTLCQTANRNNHNRIVAFGCLVLFCFLPTWLSVVWRSILDGSSGFLLNLGFAYIGGDILWKHRHQLTTDPATEEEKVLGYFLILGSAAFFPFCLTSISLQALISMMILVGIIISYWGLAVIQKHPLAMLLILISVYPDISFLASASRRTLTGNQLEVAMAWMGGMALKGIGQTVTIQGDIIALAETLKPEKSVWVGSGCSGFDMAFPVAGFAFIMGMYFKQSWQKILALVAIGVALALAFNVPRIMLLAIAVVYWGKDSFDFWHGPIGGQIFSTIMLTLYYYIAMAMIEQKPKQISSK